MHLSYEGWLFKDMHNMHNAPFFIAVMVVHISRSSICDQFKLWIGFITNV